MTPQARHSAALAALDARIAGHAEVARYLDAPGRWHDPSADSAEVALGLLGGLEAVGGLLAGCRRIADRHAPCRVCEPDQASCHRCNTGWPCQEWLDATGEEPSDG